tara:strand:- start:672 stop:1790 length:1119 start_codon:yes stop_codon:yes gene_type:complete
MGNRNGRRWRWVAAVLIVLAAGLAGLGHGLLPAGGIRVGSRLMASELTWAEKMFDARSHDFGVISLTSKVTHRFTVKNLYRETVHIAGVKTTCGCSVGRPSKTTLVSGEVASIDVTMDMRRTRTQLAQKTAILTVVFDRPTQAEVRIPVKATVRKDLVMTPGSADFTGVEQGARSSRIMKVQYAGRGDWSIRQIEVNSPHLAVRAEETKRKEARRLGILSKFHEVHYDLVVDLKPSAPAGPLRETIVLVTDDKNSPRIPVLVEATVEAEFTISPSAAGVVTLGALAPGRPKRVSVVIKGRRDFRIEKIEAETPSGAFRTRVPTSKRRVQVLPLTVTAPTGVRELRETFTVTIEDRVEPVTFEVLGQVVPAAR